MSMPVDDPFEAFGAAIYRLLEALRVQVEEKKVKPPLP